MTIAAVAALATSDKPLWLSIRPRRDFVVVEVEEERTIAPGGVVVTLATKGLVTSQEQQGHVGTVISCGPGRFLEKRDSNGVRTGQTSRRWEEMSLKPGDRIHFGEFSFPEWREDGKRWMLIQQADVTGVEEREEAA
jgi:chaperonin GroES